MTTDTREKIFTYIKEHGQARAQDLYETFGISRVAVHRQINKLLDEGMIVRRGKPPVVFYTLPPQITKPLTYVILSQEVQQTVEANFLSITPDGRLLYGLSGFAYWAQNYQKNKPLELAAREYVKAVQNQQMLFSEGGWIDATEKLVETFRETPITHLLFSDVYSYRIFGRTKLAKLVMYAKQTGQRQLIDQIAGMAKPLIEAIVRNYQIEAVAFIPPTVPRPVQFMDELEHHLDLQLAKIDLIKIMPGDIPIPQKTLASLHERVINARDTIYLEDNKTYPYKNILLIDDVIGSGASFHETAKKLRSNQIGPGEIIAFGLVGNIKGFDVVREI